MRYLTHGLVVAALALPVLAAQPVKLSSSGICHDSQSPYYPRVKHYQPYSTLEQCLSDGGRLPKTSRGAGATTNAASTQKKPGYRRELFGDGWADQDGDCQTTRHELLAALSTVPVQYKSHRQCKVVRGRWVSSFTGDIHVQASAMDIDHVVPLAWAYHHGADAWPYSTRVEFGNDPANLLPVERSLNRAKGAKGLNEWLPPTNECQYITRFERVRISYGLPLSSTEQRHYAAVKRQHCNL
ncbi:HNH endonuclease family protein [Ferrimonas kyonanensis]|uniref:HNH endonuclease family protein n=1 Tax=Ferrimonas kyonanensis TaxID=364763 RepID=UPI00054F2502|nr:HNH endonuclease family protein [Ferrimonas kyonanensis]